MNFRINREIKAFCKDFRPIRRILKKVGATFLERKEQVDYYFFLPDSAGNKGSRRLKLRVENRRSQIIYYHDKNHSGLRSVRFQLFEVSDPQIRDVLETALGVKVVVKKRREVWKKGNAIFNLDNVVGVGKIFEVEVELSDGDDQDQQIVYYQNLFGPHLGEEIIGSNEDLVAS